MDANTCTCHVAMPSGYITRNDHCPMHGKTKPTMPDTPDVDALVDCPICHATGKRPCPRCRGVGHLYHEGTSGRTCSNDDGGYEQCVACGGTRFSNKPCLNCNGDGQVLARKNTTPNADVDALVEEAFGLIDDIYLLGKKSGTRSGMLEGIITTLADLARKNTTVQEGEYDRLCSSCGEYMVHIDTAELIDQETQNLQVALDTANRERDEVAVMAADLAAEHVGAGATPQDFVNEARRRIAAAREETTK